MIKFIILLVIVFIGVELLVRFILEPLFEKSYKKKKVSKPSSSKLNPEFRLAAETMYDGGKPHAPEKGDNKSDGEKITKDGVIS